MVVKPKIIVVLGPTATGKSDVAVNIAKKINGEIISADSRQVYRGMDLGSGKVTRDSYPSKSLQLTANSYLYLGVPHHLLDVANPKNQFSVAQFQKIAEEKINEIIERGHLPIICGGTGFYIDTLVQGLHFPKVKSNKELRKRLEKKTPIELFNMLIKLDPTRAKNIDARNKVRLIRAIEIAKSLGSVPKIVSSNQYDPIYIGLDLADSELKERIRVRLKRRLGSGLPSLKLWRVNMVAEVARLHKQGVSYRRLESFGLEYRQTALFLQKKITQEEMIQNLEKEIWQFVKRQRTWFKRNKMIEWYNPLKKTSLNIIVKRVKNLLIK